MAKGYWVVFADVSDPEGYKEYIAANGKALAKYNARFLARGGKTEPKEGQPRSRVIVVEFPSYSEAMECYRSPEYTEAMKLRQGRSVWDMAVTEGYEGPDHTPIEAECGSSLGMNGMRGASARDFATDSRKI